MEITRNREAVRAQLPYHEQLFERLRQLHNDGVPDTFEGAFGAIGWRGPSGVMFHRTAWLAVEATGAVPLLDFETAGILSTIYAAQEDLMSLQWDFAGTALDASTWDNPQRTTFVVMLYFEMVTQLERQLLAFHKDALSNLARHLGRPTPTE